MLGMLENRDPDKAKQLDQFLFEFDDLIKIDERSLQKLLAEAQTNTLAIALVDAHTDIVDRVMASLPQRVQGNLKQEIEFIGTPPRTQAEDARREITDILRKMDKEGTLGWRS